MMNMDGWMWAMMLAGVILFVAVLFIAVWAVRRFSPSQRQSSAMTVLQERFARGDIDAEEYEQRRRTLQG
jgi:putative membrane protein